MRLSFPRNPADAFCAARGKCNQISTMACEISKCSSAFAYMKSAQLERTFPRSPILAQALVLLCPHLELRIPGQRRVQDRDRLLVGLASPDTLGRPGPVVRAHMGPRGLARALELELVPCRVFEALQHQGRAGRLAGRALGLPGCVVSRVPKDPLDLEALRVRNARAPQPRHPPWQGRGPTLLGGGTSAPSQTSRQTSYVHVHQHQRLQHPARQFRTDRLAHPRP